MPLEFLAWKSPPLDFSRTPVTVILIKHYRNNNSNNVITRFKLALGR